MAAEAAEEKAGAGGAGAGGRAAAARARLPKGEAEDWKHWYASEKAKDYAVARGWDKPPCKGTGKDGRVTIEDLRSFQAPPPESWPACGAAGAAPRTGGLRVKKEVLCDPSASSDSEACFLREYFGERTHVLEVPLPMNKTAEVHLPEVRFVHDNANTYEVVGCKVHDDGQAFKGMQKKCMRYLYVATSVLGMRDLVLQDELERVADFAALPNPRKVASRIELMQSPAVAHGVHQLDFQQFELIEEKLSAVTGEPMCDGCGFIPDELLTTLFGRSVAGFVALQVRIFGPRLGVFKGVLCRKPGISRVQLPLSMRKVGPSRFSADDWVTLLVVREHPTSTNVVIGRHLQGVPPPESFKPKKLSTMVTNLWRALGVRRDAVEQYERRRYGDHAWVVGVADPTGALPAGHVFATGLGPLGAAGRQLERLFVTRSPCVMPADGRVLPVVRQRPEAMSEDVWAWLQELPFGALLFSAEGEDAPMPATVADGDLDGDYYLVCWDAELVAQLQPREPAPAAAAAAPAAAAAGVAGLDERADPEDVAAAAAGGEAAAKDCGWLARAQEHMTDPSVLREPLLIGKLYKAFEARVETSDDGMDDADAYAFAKAYKQALDLGKHGGRIDLPEHLRAQVGLSDP